MNALHVTKSLAVLVLLRGTAAPVSFGLIPSTPNGSERDSFTIACPSALMKPSTTIRFRESKLTCGVYGSRQLTHNINEKTDRRPGIAIRSLKIQRSLGRLSLLLTPLFINTNNREEWLCRRLRYNHRTLELSKRTPRSFAAPSTL